MIIINKGYKRPTITLDEVTKGDDVFVFSNEFYGEDTDEELHPMIKVDLKEVSHKRCKPNTKGKSKREFDANNFVAVCDLETGFITIHPEECEVIIIDAELIIGGDKQK